MGGNLIAVGGLSGSGKSTLAKKLAVLFNEHGSVLWVRSDSIRKELWGASETQKLPPDAYTKNFSSKVYDEMDKQITDGLSQGFTVIADRLYSLEVARNTVEEIAFNAGAGFVGFWLDAPPTIMKQRVDLRTDDASDADSAIIDLQLGFDLGQIGWHKIDAAHTPDRTYDQVIEILNDTGFLQKKYGQITKPPKPISPE